jgi:hypothetical protein
VVLEEMVPGKTPGVKKNVFPMFQRYFIPISNKIKGVVNKKLKMLNGYITLLFNH